MTLESTDAPATAPAVSVLMPVFNGGVHLAAAVESVLAQDFAAFEFLIVDDGSTDGSGERLETCAARDARIRLIRAQHGGLVRALNTMLGLARAPLVARMDADDIAVPERLRLQLDAFRARPRLGALGGHIELIDGSSRRTGISFAPMGARAIRRVARQHSPLSHPAVMMRKAAVAAVGGYRAAFEATEDYDLWLRLLDAGWEIDNLPHVVLRYRQHESSMSGMGHRRQELLRLMARAGSDMRRAGLPDPFDALDAIDWDTPGRIPGPFRPCAAELWEAANGPVQAAPAALAAEAVHAVETPARDHPGRRPTARFFLRAALRLARGGRSRDARRALRRALAADPLVLPRQLGFTLSRKVPRGLRRLHHALSHGASGRRAPAAEPQDAATTGP